MNDIIIISAEEAGLHYINDSDLIYRRERKGKNFVYFNGNGKKVRDKKLLKRFTSLIIPPAWESVTICADENGHIQATGRDARGRKQYIYHSKWEEVRNSNKFGKMLEFAEVLPHIRKHVEHDLKRKDLSKEKVLAVIIKLLEDTLIRIGNKAYAISNNSYGLTTLKDNHIKVKGHTLKFEFVGKSGKELQLDFTDRRLARIVKQCQDIPGQHLFQYFDESGNRCKIESNDVNNYLNSITNKNFTAKDFRTWGGTITALEELIKMPLSDNQKENEKNIVQVVKLVAKKLNNTSAICRKYYIHPALLQSYLDGYLFKAMEKASLKKTTKFNLNLEERALIKILKKYN